MALMPKNGNWITELIARGVIVEIDKTLPRVPGGVVLVCDSETNPTQIVSFDVPEDPVRLFAHECGVLIASPDVHKRRRHPTGIDPMKVIAEPIARAWREGIRRVILCANPHAVAGPMLSLHTIDLIDHLVRAGEWLSKVIEGLPVGYIVHFPREDGSFTNYYVDLGTWHAFYAQYEVEVLHRQADEDPGMTGLLPPTSAGGNGDVASAHAS